MCQEVQREENFLVISQLKFVYNIGMKMLKALSRLCYELSRNKILGFYSFIQVHANNDRRLQIIKVLLQSISLFSYGSDVE